MRGELMYKILIVDDEMRHLRGLAELLGRLRPHYSIDTATNGKEALDCLDKEEYHILITDVVMPVMNGIELSKELYLMKHKVKTIILSAYGEFEYARKAIQYGVTNYLLKPVSESEIIEALMKLEYELTHKVELERKHAVSNELLMYKWLNDQLSISDTEELIQQFSLQGHKGAVAQLHLKCLEDIDTKELDSLREKIHLYYSQSDKEHQVISLIIKEENVKVILIYHHNQEHIPQQVFIKDMNQLSQQLQNTHIKVQAMSLSNTLEEIETQLQSAYKMSETALNFGFYKSNEVIRYEDIYRFLKNKMPHSKNAYKDLLSIIEKKDWSQSIKFVGHLDEEAIKNGLVPTNKLKEFWIYILTQVIEDKWSAEEQQYALLKEKIRPLITQSPTLHIMERHIEDLLREIVVWDKENPKQQERDFYSMCLEYVHHNYNTHLSLEKMAELFYYNPSYFSAQFKKHSGTTFSTYLRQLRIEKSQEYLCQTNLKVYEIANKVGYEDAKYFNRVFKKKVGVTPDEYRRHQKEI